jgi:AcrR family transcriptional regulator
MSRARDPLSRAKVLDTAVALADDSGIGSVTMRKLGEALGVEAMSLYNHVANKDDILDGIVDVVASEIELPLDGADWKSALRRTAISFHEALLRHPWAGSIWMRRGVSAARLRHGDAVLRSLREGGFSKDLTYHAFHILEAHVLGFTLQQLSFPFDKEELAELAARFLRDFPADEYPDLAEHIKQHMEPRHDDAGAFEIGLDLILDGLERVRDTA